MSQVQGKGTTLTIGSAVSEVISISGPTMSAGVVETKTLDATWVLRYPTICDGGTVSFDVYFSQATHGTLAGYLGTLQTGNVITFADGATCTFDGILTKCEITAGTIDDMLQASLEISISDEVELQGASGP